MEPRHERRRIPGPADSPSQGVAGLEGRAAEAIKQWGAAVEANPRDFGSRRALGLAYAEQGGQVEKAAAQLEKAIEINPAHV